MKVLVLGAGRMNDAILTGLAKSENLSDWMIYSPSGTTALNLASKVGASAIADLSQVNDPDWILVGCKPQQLKDLKMTLNGRFKECLFVSVLAAIPEADQLNILEAKGLVRVMPNLPVEYNEGVCLISSASAKSHLQSFQYLFSKLGTAMVVEEKELEELTLLTGSGPAFFYEFADLLARSFDSLDPIHREKLVRQVLKGCASSVAHNSGTLPEMVNAVTSKGGVTIAVLDEWKATGFQGVLKKGILAGKKRSGEIKTSLQS